MRFLHTADWHLDATTHGGINPATGLDRAFESNRAAGASVVTAALEAGVEVFLLAGDVFEHGRPSAEAVLAAAEILAPLAGARIPIVMVGGNHELTGVPTGQRTATALLADALVGTVPGAEVHAAQRVPRLVTTSTGCQVMCLPWQSRTRLASRDTDRTAADRQVVDHILAAMEQMMVLADPDAPLVLAAHLTASERARRGSETDLADLFDEPVVPAGELEAFPFAYGALGHIHTRQKVGARCYYSGSPNRLTFADAGVVKSANLVDLAPGSTRVHAVATNARPMHVIDLAGPGADERLAALEPDALVRLCLPPGIAQVPGPVLAAVKSSGARIAAAPRRPAPMPDQPRTAAALPERIDPVEALRTRLAATHDPDVVARICALAAELEGVDA